MLRPGGVSGNGMPQNLFLYSELGWKLSLFVGYTSDPELYLKWASLLFVCQIDGFSSGCCHGFYFSLIKQILPGEFAARTEVPVTTVVLWKCNNVLCCLKVFVYLKFFLGGGGIQSQQVWPSQWPNRKRNVEDSSSVFNELELCRELK